MMFGRRERFPYYRCANCDCLQLAEVPFNLAEHYPANYYSLQTLTDEPVSWALSLKRRWAFPAMTRHKLGWGSQVGGMLCRFKSGPPFPEWLRFLTRPIAADGGILDVGCGSGLNLLELRNCGFTCLRGVDPFVAQSIVYDGDIRVEKCQLRDMKGKYSLITFHHVFEHLEDPLASLAEARALLAEGGQILIRIPLADSVAAKKYGEHWAQLDAPRHITLHTRKSMELAAAKSGLKIARVTYDSTGFQFWGSEQYLMDVPLFDPRSQHFSPSNGYFSGEQLNSFVAEAKRLNQQEAGDQAAFVLVEA
jgi:SAM-dependent methyltransferase